MPFKVRKRGEGPKPWKIINERTGKVVGSSETREKGLASVRARMAFEESKKENNTI